MVAFSVNVQWLHSPFCFSKSSSNNLQLSDRTLYFIWSIQAKNEIKYLLGVIKLNLRYRVTGSDRDYEPGHVFQNYFMWLLLTSRFDRVYYGNRLEDTKSDMDLEPLFQFVAAPIDQRSTPAEQVRSKEAYDVIKKWANDPNGFIICCDQKKWRTLMEMRHYLAHTVAMWSLVKGYMIAWPTEVTMIHHWIMMNDCGTINAREKKKDWHKKLSCEGWIDMAVIKYYLDIY